MKIGFHSNHLGIRGSEVALFDYAHFNEKLLNNESVIIYNFNNNINNNEVVDKFTKKFPVCGYENINEINYICDKEKLDAVYFIKSGKNDGKLSNKKNLIHVVFQEYEPHGEVYVYVSEWLCNKISLANNKKLQWVPHIVTLPCLNYNYRKEWGISKDALVIGRYGGFDQFNIEFAHRAVVKYVNKNTNCYFVFVNTRQFCNHPRILFLNGIIEMQKKSNFISSCDAMIHARSDGESFGLAICEFLYNNKPVLAYNGGNDQHHIDILSGTNLLYNSEQELLTKFEMLESGIFKKDYKYLVEKFSPEHVMKIFNSVFLKPSTPMFL
jgi:glycosyltransferase involved in cell wall biosynthesis